MKRLKGFTLAEVLITLAIIGVVAALTIPSVISNSQQQEFKTGLRKAVSVLNSAITMNMAIDGESPYDNKDLFNYLQRHMSVLKTTGIVNWVGQYVAWDGSTYRSGWNGAFYTTDGMRFEFDDDGARVSGNLLKLHESPVHACFESISHNSSSCGGKGCGSYGLKHNPNNTNVPPCAILVDVNGDRKPTPQKTCANGATSCTSGTEGGYQNYWVPTLDSKRVSDIFVILITEDRAIPYGVVAQKAMYQAQAKK